MGIQLIDWFSTQRYSNTEIIWRHHMNEKLPKGPIFPSTNRYKFFYMVCTLPLTVQDWVNICPMFPTSASGHHWFGLRFITYSTSSHYLIQVWLNSIAPLALDVNEIWIDIWLLSFKKMNQNVVCEWSSFCSGFIVLKLLVMRIECLDRPLDSVVVLSYEKSCLLEQ